MNYLLPILLLLTLAATSDATEFYSCSGRNVEIKSAGFYGYNAEAKKIKSVGRFSVATSDASNYQRSFEIGAYRFAKEGEQWAIYRKNDQGRYELRRELKFPVKVSVDQPIYVSQRSKTVLEVRRNTDDTNSTSMTVVFGRSQMEAKDASGKNLVIYTLCPVAKASPDSAPAAIPGVRN